MTFRILFPQDNDVEQKHKPSNTPNDNKIPDKGKVKSVPIHVNYNILIIYFTCFSIAANHFITDDYIFNHWKYIRGHKSQTLQKTLYAIQNRLAVYENTSLAFLLLLTHPNVGVATITTDTKENLIIIDNQQKDTTYQDYRTQLLQYFQKSKYKFIQQQYQNIPIPQLYKKYFLEKLFTKELKANTQEYYENQIIKLL